MARFRTESALAHDPALHRLPGFIHVIEIDPQSPITDLTPQPRGTPIIRIIVFDFSEHLWSANIQATHSNDNRVIRKPVINHTQVICTFPKQGVETVESVSAALKRIHYLYADRVAEDAKPVGERLIIDEERPFC